MYLLKYRDLYTKSPIVLPDIKVKGEFRLVSRWADTGAIKYDSGWRPNILTNAGLVWKGYSHYNKMAIGTGNTPPAVTDTILAAQLGDQKSIGGNSGAPNATYVYQKTYPGTYTAATSAARFDTSYVGTIRELGIGDSTSTSVPMPVFYRTLVTPEYVKTDQEVLDVYHRVTQYWDGMWGPNTGQIDISGVTYDWASWGYYWNEFSQPHQPLTITGAYTFSGIPDPWVSLTDHLNPDRWVSTLINDNGTYPNGIGGATTTTTSVSPTRVGDYAYTERDCYWGLNDGNNNIGPIVRGIKVHPCSSFDFGVQIAFANALDGTPIPKDNTKIMHIFMRTQWSRL